MESSTKPIRIGAIVACALALGAGRDFYTRSISPLLQKESEIQRESDAVDERIENARLTIAKTRTLETNADKSRSELERLQDELPAGSPMVSMPALVGEHFTRHGLNAPLIRLNTTREEPKIPGYRRGYWSLAVPIDKDGANIPTLLSTIADLEQQYAFLRVLDFAIRPDPENPDARVGLMNFASVIRK